MRGDELEGRKEVIDRQLERERERWRERGRWDKFVTVLHLSGSFVVFFHEVVYFLVDIESLICFVSGHV